MIDTNSDAAPREAERDHDDKRRRIDELVSPVFTVAQCEVLASSPTHFDSETQNNEIAVDVALPEEPTGMSEDSGRGWITEEAFFTFSLGWQQMRQRKEVKMNHLSLAEKREFLNSMQIEWQALLKSQSARVLSSEETVQARACWPDRAMDTRWVRTWKSDESMTSGRRAKARLVSTGFTDPDLLNIESHSSALTREGFMTVLQSVCSHGHKRDLIKRGQPLFVRMPPDGIPGESREVWAQLFKEVHGPSDDTRKWRNGFLATVRGIGFETSVLEPCVLVLRDSQQKDNGILGMANSDIAGGGDEVWEQAISELKRQRFTFARWEVEKGIFGGREVVQTAGGSMRVGQFAFLKNLDFVSLGKTWKEPSEDANETEKAAIVSVLGTLGYLARESRPDL